MYYQVIGIGKNNQIKQELVMKRYAYRCNGIAGEVFINPKEEVERIAIFCFGFPGNTGVNPTVSMLVSLGYAVFVHQYSGTYDSDGEFEIPLAIDSIVDLSKLINDGGIKDIKKHALIPLNNKKVTLLAGHSFGCFIGGRAATKISSLKNVILLAPILGYGSDPVNYAVLEDGIYQLEYVVRARPFTFRFGNLTYWQEMFNGKHNSWKDSTIALENIISIVGDNDSDFDLEMLEKNYDEIVGSVFTNYNKSSLHVVKNAGHSDSDLITPKIVEKIIGIIK